MSIMHQALCVREVLANVFRSLEPSDLFSCALVCEDWTDIALDPLWREVDLRAIISPFSTSCRDMEEGALGFWRPIKHADWERFDWYARRVRTLSLDFDWYHEPSVELFAEMALKKPSSVLLPNLRRLEVSSTSAKTLSFPLIFMSENVTELLFRFPGDRDDYGDLNGYIDDFFLEVSKRMPKLKTLEVYNPRFRENTRHSAAESSISEFLSSTKCLEAFICFPYCITSYMMEYLSRLPNLQVVGMKWGQSIARSRRSSLRFDRWFSPGPFPSLVDLSFCATFTAAMDMMEFDLAPKLVALHIHSPQAETADSTRRLLLVLARKHPKLSKLRLTSLGSNANGHLQLPDGGDRIDESTLSPLLNISSLTSFGITYHRQLYLYNHSLKGFLTNWPALENLSLCSDPCQQEQPCLTSNSLAVIAECCPKLRRLSLYIDTRIRESSYPSRLSFLERIEFGMSPLAEEDVTDFALFLSEVLPPTCNTASLCDISWGGLVEPELRSNGLKTLNEDWKNWSELSKTLSLLLKARSRERYRVRELEGLRAL